MSNLLDYSDRRTNLGEPILFNGSPDISRYQQEQFSLNQEEKNKQLGLVNLIFQTFTNWKPNTTIFWSYMLAATSAFLWSETLQTSSLITSDAHNDNTVTTFGYDIIITWLVSYFILNQQKLYSHNKPDTLLYWLFLHGGAIGFALLGQVPFLKHIAIVKDFWKHLSPAAWIVILFFGLIIVGIGLKELVDSCRKKTIKGNLLNICLVGGAYGYMLYILHEGGAKDIHYHIHHAIFAGVLSFWFTNWENCWEKILNAILMGIVIEGINFYGVGELFLFLTNGETEMTFSTTLGISSIFSVILLILFFFAYFFKKIR